MCTQHRNGIDFGDLALQVLAGSWWLLCRVALPAAAIAVVLGWRWLSGAALSGRTLPSTFRRGATAPGPLSWRRPRWVCWPGWCRAAARWLASSVLAGLFWWPAVTVAVVSLLVAAVAAFAVVRRRQGAGRAQAAPTGGDLTRPALGPAVTVPLVWDADPVRADAR